MGVIAASIPEGVGIDLMASLPYLFFDLQFNGQAMAVPTGNIGRIKAVQGLGFDNDVFQYLVERMSEMNFAIGIGRPVMEDKFRFAGGVISDPPIKIHFPPAFQHFRFPLGQVSLHGEIRLG